MLTGTEPDSSELSARLQCVKELTDIKSLELIVRKGAESELRLAALTQVDREALLGDLAIQDPDQHVRLEALAKISQKSTLERVLKQTRAKDKRVSALAKEKLNTLLMEQERPLRLKQQGKQLCVELEGLIKPRDWGVARERFKSIESEWQAVMNEWNADKDGIWDNELAERFNKARKHFRTVLDAHVEKETEQRAMELQRDPIRARKRAVCEELEGLLSMLQQREVPRAEDEESVNEALSISKQRYKEAGLLSAAEEHAFQSRFEVAHKILENYKADMVLYRSSHDAVQGFIQRVEKLLKSPQPIKEKALKDLDRQWNSIKHPSHFKFDAEMENLGKESLKKIHERRAKELQKRQENIETFKRLVGELEKALNSGRSQEAANTHRRAQKLVSRMSEHDAALLRNQGFQQRFQNAATQVQELRDWKRWASTPKKEKLVEEMEALAKELNEHPEQIHDYTTTTRQIQMARDEWKKLGESEPDSAQELWDRFNAACNLAYEPCKAYFDEQSQIRRDNLGKKNIICKALEDFVAAADWDNMDWKKAERIVRVAQNEWSDIGSVDRKDKNEINKRFRTVMDIMRQHIKEEHDRNQNAKEALIGNISGLIEEVKGLEKDSAGLQNAIDKVKELQGKWKSIGLATKDRELWKQFRAACDVIFTKRQAVFEAKDQERQENLARKNAVCERIEALAKLEGETLKQARGQFEQAKTEWTAIGPLPKGTENEASKQFKQACRHFQHQDSLRIAAEQNAQTELFLQKAKLCTHLESAAEDLLDNKITNDHASEQLESAQKTWQGMATLEDHLEQAILGRFQSDVEIAMGLINNRDRAMEQIIKAKTDNLEKKKLLCLRMEILAGVESPPEARQARMEYQILQLADKMKQADVLGRREKQQADEKEAVVLFREWWATGTVPLEEAKGLDQRFDTAREAFLTAHKEHD